MRMKRKLKPRKKVQNRFTKHSLVLGLLSDLHTLIKLVMAIISWPVKTIAHGVHTVLKPHLRHIKHNHAHAAICVALGVTVLGVSFVAEHMFQHVAWNVTIETMRAAGVCPIWETLATLLNIGKDLEA
jgi:hypothetical protein